MESNKELEDGELSSGSDEPIAAEKDSNKTDEEEEDEIDKFIIEATSTASTSNPGSNPNHSVQDEESVMREKLLAQVVKKRYIRKRIKEIKEEGELSEDTENVESSSPVPAEALDMIETARKRRTETRKSSKLSNTSREKSIGKNRSPLKSTRANKEVDENIKSRQESRRSRSRTTKTAPKADRVKTAVKPVANVQANQDNYNYFATNNAMSGPATQQPVIAEPPTTPVQDYVRAASPPPPPASSNDSLLLSPPPPPPPKFPENNYPPVFFFRNPSPLPHTSVPISSINDLFLPPPPPPPQLENNLHERDNYDQVDMDVEDNFVDNIEGSHKRLSDASAIREELLSQQNRRDRDRRVDRRDDRHSYSGRRQSPPRGRSRTPDKVRSLRAERRSLVRRFETRMHQLGKMCERRDRLLTEVESVTSDIRRHREDAYRTRDELTKLDRRIEAEDMAHIEKLSKLSYKGLSKETCEAISKRLDGEREENESNESRYKSDEQDTPDEKWRSDSRKKASSSEAQDDQSEVPLHHHTAADAVEDDEEELRRKLLAQIGIKEVSPGISTPATVDKPNGVHEQVEVDVEPQDQIRENQLRSLCVYDLMGQCKRQSCSKVHAHQGENRMSEDDIVKLILWYFFNYEDNALQEGSDWLFTTRADFASFNDFMRSILGMLPVEQRQFFTAFYKQQVYRKVN